MEAFLSQLLAWVAANPVWTGLIVFAVSLAESLAIVGIIVPGVVMMFGIGALIAAGAADFWAICAWAVAGAVLGDGLSYWLGRRYKAHLRDTWPFTRYPRTLEQGERFFERYGGISVAFGRFFGPGRATVPLVAGMLEMPPGAFLLANVASALLWAPAYLIPGVVIGASLELASEVAFGLVALILLLIGLAWFTGWLAHRVFLAVQPHTKALLARLVRLGDRVRWLRRIADAMADPNHPEARGLAVFGSLLIVGALTLALVSTALVAMQSRAGLQQTVTELMSSLRNPTADRFMAPLALVRPGEFVLLAGGASALVLAAARRRQALAHWLAGLAFAGVVLAIHRVSGHHPGSGVIAPDPGTLTLAVAVGLLAVVIAPAVTERLRWSVYSTGVVLVVLTGFARLYFGLTDPGGLLTGMLLALTWVAGVGIAYRTHAVGEAVRLPVAALALAGFIAGAGLAGLRTEPPPAVTARGEPVALSAENWRSGGWQTLPLLRGDLLHTSTHPLNLQYAGSLADLDQRLRAAGWTRRQPAVSRDLLRWLSPSLPLAQLPLLPHVHDGRHETAAWSRPLGDSRLVVRLWPAPATLDGAPALWVGAASAQVKRERLGLLAYAVTSDRFDEALRALRADLGAAAMTLRDGPHGRVGLLD
ncbi:MAG: VTT domain-containing protein [Gammaproteobacteria bacterium]